MRGSLIQVERTNVYVQTTVRDDWTLLDIVRTKGLISRKVYYSCVDRIT